MSNDQEFKEFEILSFTDWKKVTQAETQAIAIPTEIPIKPTLSHIPKEIIRSGTVETLIGHNDDLATRLKVNLRRNSILEQRILELEHNQSAALSEYESQKIHYDVIREKESLYRECIKKFEIEHESLHEELETLEMRFAEVHQENQKIKVQLKQNLNDQITAETLTHKQRNRIELKIRGSFKKLYNERKKYADELLRAEALLRKKDNQVEQMRLNLSMTVNQLQEKEHEWRENEKTLTLFFEAENSNLTSRCDTLLKEKEALLRKTNSLERMALENAEKDNQLVRVERELLNQKTEFATELDVLQGQAGSYRKEAKILFLENEQIKKELTERKNQVRELKHELKVLENSNESLLLLIEKKGSSMGPKPNCEDDAAEDLELLYKDQATESSVSRSSVSTSSDVD